MSEVTPTTYGPRPQTQPSRGRRLAGLLIPPFILGGVLTGVWYYASYVWLQGRRRVLLAPPHKVLTKGFGDWEHLREILAAAGRSGDVALRGLVIAVVIGLTLATLMSQARSVERAVWPFMISLQAIPILAMVPVIGLLFDTGKTSRVIVCVIFSLFPMVVNALFGLKSADQGHHDLFTLNNASRWTRLTRLMIPGAMPAVFAGLRISASLALIGGIVSDFFFGRGQVGLGQMIVRFKNDTNSPLVLTSIAVACIFGVIVFLVFSWIERKVVGKWYEGSGRSGPRP